jgi:hypothetical protein
MEFFIGGNYRTTGGIVATLAAVALLYRRLHVAIFSFVLERFKTVAEIACKTKTMAIG